MRHRRFLGVALAMIAAPNVAMAAQRDLSGLYTMQGETVGAQQLSSSQQCKLNVAEEDAHVANIIRRSQETSRYLYFLFEHDAEKKCPPDVKNFPDVKNLHIGSLFLRTHGVLMNVGGRCPTKCIPAAGGMCTIVRGPGACETTESINTVSRTRRYYESIFTFGDQMLRVTFEKYVKEGNSWKLQRPSLPSEIKDWSDKEARLVNDPKATNLGKFTFSTDGNCPTGGGNIFVYSASVIADIGKSHGPLQATLGNMERTHFRDSFSIESETCKYVVGMEMFVARADGLFEEMPTRDMSTIGSFKPAKP